MLTGAVKRSPGRASAGAAVGGAGELPAVAAAGGAEVKSPNSWSPRRSEEAEEGRAVAGAASRPSRSVDAEGAAEDAAEGAVTGRGSGLVITGLRRR